MWWVLTYRARAKLVPAGASVPGHPGPPIPEAYPDKVDHVNYLAYVFRGLAACSGAQGSDDQDVFGMGVYGTAAADNSPGTGVPAASAWLGQLLNQVDKEPISSFYLPQSMRNQVSAQRTCCIS